jgi:hypothetical protein
MSTDTQYVISETRLQRMLSNGAAVPRFLQGVYPFAGRGVFDLAPLHDELAYVVPKGKVGQVLYVRGGNHSEDLLYLAITVDGKPVRYFPVGPKADFHVPLAIVEDYPAGSRIELCLAAPRGLTGTVIVDVGMVEVEASAGGTISAVPEVDTLRTP